MAAESNITPWTSWTPIVLPKEAVTAGALAKYAKLLRPSDVQRVTQAFESGLYPLAVEYVWSRSMSALKQQLATLGMKFIGEMLNRPEIDEDDSIDLVLTDYDALTLANQLGVITGTGALELRQSAELIAHYMRADLGPGEELNPIAALNTLRVSVEHILGREKIEVAMDFADFRNRLTKEAIAETDDSIQRLIFAPYFFKRTAIRLLLADAKSARGAQSSNALSNINTIVPLIWESLQDPDRWQIGESYAEASAAGQRLLSASLKRTLLKVRGFDYVPETLRSNTYRVAAAAVLDAHRSYNNFYLEAEPMEALAKLGSSIPGPAFAATMQAVLSVKLGNFYGIANAAQGHANLLLNQLTAEQWQVYFSKFLPSDEVILGKLTQSNPVGRWCQMIVEFELGDIKAGDTRVTKLISAGAKKQESVVTANAETIFKSLSKLKK